MTKLLSWAEQSSRRVANTPFFSLSFLLCAVTLAASADPAAKSYLRPVRRVLVINSYAEGDAWGDPLVHGIQAAFYETQQRIDADFEFLDARHYPDAVHESLFIHYVAAKIAGNPPEAIVAADDPAVKLVLQYRGTLLPAVPVVFCGVNEFENSSAYVVDHAAERPWMTGILERIDIQETVELALHLHPGTRRLITVGDGTDIAAAVHKWRPELDVSALDALKLSLEEIGRRLDRLPPDTVVLFSPFPHDGLGRSLEIGETARFVSNHARVPVYTASRASLGFGPIGGKMADPYLQGRTAASITLTVLNGSAPSSLGVQRNTANAFEFDYNQLRRWRIPEARLPGGSVVINRPKSLRETHPLLLMAVSIFLCVQSLVIGVLLVQRRRRQLAEAALRKHSQQLANSNYMLEQFAYIAAHDFQEPIRSVALFAELLRGSALGKLDEEERQAVHFVFDNSRRLLVMVRGLLAWVRSVEAQADSPLWCDVAQVWRDVLKRHQDETERRGVKFESASLPGVAMHAHHMRELLNHLVENALHHGDPSDLLITIRSERDDTGWKFRVFNTGQPIPESLQSRVFGVFRRLQPGNPQSGVGMGLAICRRIVDFYGGRIWVEREIRDGCALCFTIPDTPRPRAVRLYRGFSLPITFSSSTHAHSNHRG